MQCSLYIVAFNQWTYVFKSIHISINVFMYVPKNTKCSIRIWSYVAMQLILSIFTNVSINDERMIALSKDQSPSRRIFFLLFLILVNFNRFFFVSSRKIKNSWNWLLTLLIATYCSFSLSASIFIYRVYAISATKSTCLSCCREILFSTFVFLRFPFQCLLLWILYRSSWFKWVENL